MSEKTNRTIIISDPEIRLPASLLREAVNRADRERKALAAVHKARAFSSGLALSIVFSFLTVKKEDFQAVGAITSENTYIVLWVVFIISLAGVILLGLLGKYLSSREHGIEAIVYGLIRSESLDSDKKPFALNPTAIQQNFEKLSHDEFSDQSLIKTPSRTDNRLLLTDENITTSQNKIPSEDIHLHHSNLEISIMSFIRKTLFVRYSQIEEQFPETTDLETQIKNLIARGLINKSEKNVFSLTKLGARSLDAGA